MPQPGLYGRNAPEPGRPRLFMDDYFTAETADLPPFNPSASYKVPSWPMYLNGPDPAAPPQIRSGIGCCTGSYIGHAVQAVTASYGAEVTMGDPDILAAYSGYGGYVLGDPSTDNGATLQAMLAYWRKTGVTVGGDTAHPVLLAAFGELRSRTPANLNIALQVARTVCLGVNFPDSAMAQFQAGEPFTPVAGAAIDGGHCMGLQAFTPGIDELHPTTWGQLWSMSKAWNARYTEEAWIPLLPQVLADAIDGGLLAKDKLAAAFRALTGTALP